MADLVLGILIVAATSLVTSAPWIVCVVLGWIAYRHRRRSELVFAMMTFGSLVIFALFRAVAAVYLLPTLVDLGWSLETAMVALDATSLFFDVAHSALLVLVALAFFRLLRGNYAFAAHR